MYQAKKLFSIASFMLSLVLSSATYSAEDSQGEDLKTISSGSQPSLSSISTLPKADNQGLFILFEIPTTNVLIPTPERGEFGPSAFSRSRTEGRFIDIYSDLLFAERIDRLGSYYKVEEGAGSLDDTEEMYLNEMIEAGKILLQHSHPHTLTQKSPFYIAACQQFTHAAFSYLEYRTKGIRRHLRTRNIEPFYQSMGRDSFAEHRRQQESAMSLFEKQLNVLRIRKHLSSLAPLLRTQERESAEEFLAEPHNSHDGAFVEFKSPPCLHSIENALSTLRVLSNWKIEDDTKLIAAHRMELQRCIDVFSQTQSFVALNAYLKLHLEIERLTQASLDPTSWNLHQKEFWQSLPVGLLMGVGKFIPYKYAEVDENKVREMRGTLKNKLAALEDHLEARRYIQHFFIQWPSLKRLGLLTFHARKLERPFHTDILLEAARELIPELRDIVLPQVESWLNFEMASAMGRLSELGDFNSEQSVPSTPILTTLASYAADVAYLTKLNETLSDLEKVDELPLVATLRVLTILGEAAKNLSDYAKVQLDPDLCARLAKMRNKIHHSRIYLRKLSRILKGTSGLEALLLNDFKSLATQVKTLLSTMPITWEAIKVCYTVTPTSAGTSTSTKKGILDLLERVDAIVSPEDYALLCLTKASRVTNLGRHRDYIVESLANSSAATKVQQADFKTHLDSLTPLTKGEKEKIFEFYKKLRIGGRRAYMLKGVLDLINKGPNGTLSEDVSAKLQQFKALLESPATQPNEEEAIWVEFLKGIYIEKVDQNKILQGVKAIYHPTQIEKEEDQEQEGLKKLLQSEKFAEKTDNKWDQEVENLIGRLKSYSSPVSSSDAVRDPNPLIEMIEVEKALSSELDRLGITDKKPWEIVRRKIHDKNKKNPTPILFDEKGETPQKHIESVLEDSMDAVSGLLEHLSALDRLTLDPKGHLGRVDLTVFWSAPKIHLSAAHHIEMIRQYADVLQEAIYYLIRHDAWSPYAKALSDFYHILSLKIKSIRLAGNYFAHLHDVTEYESMSPYGIKMSLFNQCLCHVDGLPYGGRDGHKISYLPSLRKQLETYAEILGPLYERAKDRASSPSQASNPTRPPDVPPVVFNALFNGHPVRLEEREVLGDGNCGFTGLGLMRATSIEQLIAQFSTNADIAAMVRDDVREAFRGRDLPPRLMARLQVLANQLDEQEEVVGGVLALLNDQYTARRQLEGVLVPPRLTVQEMIQDLEQEGSSESLAQRELLVDAQTQRETLEQSIWDQLDKLEVLAEFLREEFLYGGRYLSYVRSNRGTLYALAHLNNLEVHIWTRDTASNNLVESFTVPARILGAPSNIIHLYHTNYGNKLNHFNLLTVVEENPITQ